MQALINSSAELKSIATGSTYRTIYFPTVKNFRVLVPPKRMQDEYAERWSEPHTSATAMSHAVRPMDTLFASLQHSAFSSQL
jgi:hypothetical protein